MTCPINYETLQPAARVDAALTQMRAAGVPRGKAVTMVAISANEYRNMWVRDRNPPANPPPRTSYVSNDCRSCNTGVGIEFAVYAPDAHAGPHPVNVFRQHIDSPEQAGFKAFLVARGWAADSMVSIKGGPVQRRVISTGALNTLGGPAAAAALEWVIINRLSAALDHFSVGPTQMHIPAHAGPALYVKANYHSRPAFPDWQALYQFYMIAPTAGVVANRIQYYAMPAAYGVGTDWFPGNRVTDRTNGVRWLAANQTGNAESAAAYWDGGTYRGVQYNKFGVTLAATDARATALGWPP